MVIKMKLVGPDLASLKPQLIELGVAHRDVRNGGLIVELPCEGETFLIPSPLQYCSNRLLLIDDAEQYIEYGIALVVCGVTGKALKPYRIAEHRLYQAWFSYTACVTVKATKNGLIKIEHHQIIDGIQAVYIQTTILYEGNLRDLKDPYLGFQEASEAAWQKAQRYSPKVCFYCQPD